MSRLPETTTEWLDHYIRLRDRNADLYQENGEQKYYRASVKYDVIIDGLNALEEKNQEQDERLARRIRNKNAAIERLTEETYTREDLLRILGEAVYW